MSEDPTNADDADPFADVDISEVDEAELWDELEEGDGTDVDGDLFERLAEENPAQSVGPEVHTESEPVVVPKTKYCKRCQHFTDPPETACTHPGTTIAEVVDSDRFRVRNCPVVADRLGTTDVLDTE